MIRLPLIFSLIIIAAASAVSLHTLNHADPTMLVPTHWNASGEADSFMPLGQAMLFIPAIMMALVGLFALIPFVVPNRAGLEASRSVYIWSWLGVLVTLFAFHMGTALVALGRIDAATIPQLGLIALAVLFIGLGNYVAKSRQNWAVGLRTPWTLSDPDAWIAGNRTMGWGFVLTGLAVGAALFLGMGARATLIFVVGALVSALIGTAVSYATWRKNTGKT